MDFGPDDPLGATYVDLNAMFLVLNNGERVKITNLFDDDGDETTDPDDAVVVVGGSDTQGWFTVDIRGLGTEVMN